MESIEYNLDYFLSQCIPSDEIIESYNFTEEEAGLMALDLVFLITTREGKNVLGNNTKDLFDQEDIDLLLILLRESRAGNNQAKERIESMAALGYKRLDKFQEKLEALSDINNFCMN